MKNSFENIGLECTNENIGIKYFEATWYSEDGSIHSLILEKCFFCFNDEIQILGAPIDNFLKDKEILFLQIYCPFCGTKYQIEKT